MNPRQRCGFTFVEAILVGLIVAVLSAVAIPLYNGYLKKSKEDRVRNLSSTAAAAANAHYRRTGTHPDPADLNLYLSNPDHFNVDVDTDNRTVTVTDTRAEEEISATSSY